MNRPVDEAVARMFDAHSRALLLYARQWVDAAEAQDVVQRVFVRLLTSRRLPDDPRTWLFRCVRNDAISAWRKMRRRLRRESSATRDAVPWFVSNSEDRVEAVAAQEALQALDPVQREVVTLRIWSGLTLAQISSVTGLPISTVHDQFKAALKLMRQRLESPWPKTTP